MSFPAQKLSESVEASAPLVLNRFERSFTVELRDLYIDKDEWTYAEVIYEPEHLGSGEIEAIQDEFGVMWKLEELSPFDRYKVEADLVQNLVADRMYRSHVEGEE